MKRIRGGLWTSLLLIAFGLAACFSPSSDEVPEPDPNLIETDLTEPIEVIDAFSKAFTKRNYEAYAALLDVEFEFCPLADDAEDFPWLSEPCWDRATELGIIANMFDPNYAGPGHPVLTGNELQCTVLSQKVLQEGMLELVCTASFRVMSNDNYWAFDTRLIFTLIPRDGFLRIRRITEAGAGRDPRVDDHSSTWGRIKAMFRDDAGSEASMIRKIAP